MNAVGVGVEGLGVGVGVCTPVVQITPNPAEFQRAGTS